MEITNENIIPLFSKDILIKGKHAVYLKALAAKFDSDLSQGMFIRYIDVYLLAPIIGKLYTRKAKADVDQESARIMAEAINNERDRLLFNYRLIIFLEDKEILDFEERCNRAFRYDKNMEKRRAGDEIFDEYVRGGIEILYEKLIANSVENDDFTINMYNFITDANELFCNNLDVDELFELCKMASV